MRGGDGGALQRPQKYAAKRIAEREPEAALKRLSYDRGEARRIAARNDVELGGLYEILPVLLQHLVSPFLVHERGGLPQLPRILVQHVRVACLSSRRDGAYAVGSRYAGSASRRGSR